MESSVDDDRDLPLMANSDEIPVDHYLMHLDVNLERRRFVGQAYVFARPAAAAADRGGQSRSVVVEMVLDCKDIVVDRVDEVLVGDDFCQSCLTSQGVRSILDGMPRVSLDTRVETWCVRIRRHRRQTDEDEGSADRHFPRVICIHYQTQPRGASVSWRTDQDGRVCCFTQGAFINNRSLFPCQEQPTAMATWQAFVTVPPDATVVMSCDEDPRVVGTDKDNGNVTYYCFTKMRLPMSTLALAIGFWKTLVVSGGRPRTIEEEEEPATSDAGYSYSRDGVAASQVRCRLIAPACLLEAATNEMSRYMVKCLESATNHLGPFPFRRLDLLFVPRCFDSLGLASPNVTFVSQCLLAGDDSMLVHLAHEVAHAWFGLLIGAHDWTEEWLSEGFATYMEDQIHASAMQWSAEKTKEWSEIRTFLRRRILMAEVQATDSELQTLRPTKSDSKTHEKSSTTAAVVYLKNGMNPNKTFTQVHYLKGYFLLKYLSDLVGKHEFNDLLKSYVRQFNGQLVRSQELFKMFFVRFPEVRVDLYRSESGLTLTALCDRWLDSAGVPMEVVCYEPTSDNRMYMQVLTQFQWWKKHNSSKRLWKKSKWDLEEFQQVRSRSSSAGLLFFYVFATSDQLVVLLELLLDEPRLSKQTFRLLDVVYDLDCRNANVRHRWCELLIKHNYQPGLEAVQKFLVECQGMGIYLYGELMYFGRARQKDLALKCWHLLKEELGEPARRVLREMLQV